MELDEVQSINHAININRYTIVTSSFLKVKQEHTTITKIKGMHIYTQHIYIYIYLILHIN